MKLVCPHCGHDGTPPTGTDQLGSYGFNLLCDETVWFEVRVDPTTGQANVSNEINLEQRFANPRLECRVCWKSFPVPEGIPWELVRTSEPTRVLGVQAPPAREDQQASKEEPAAARLGSALAAVVQQVVEGAIGQVAERVATLEQGLSEVRARQERLNGLEARIEQQAERGGRLEERLGQLEEKLGQIAGGWQEQSMRSAQVLEKVEEMERRYQEVEGKVREAGGLLAELREVLMKIQEASKGWQEGIAARLAELSSALDELRQVGQTVEQLRADQQALQSRLDKQAEAIRTLHEAARERVQRREELRAALERLEQIAAALGETKPLPENL